MNKKILSLKKLLKEIIRRYDMRCLDKIRYLENYRCREKRYLIYKKYLKSLGENVIIDTGVFIYGMEYVTIQDNTHIDKNCIIVGSSPNLDLSSRIVKEILNNTDIIEKGEVYIGKDCHISQNTMVFGYGGVYIGNNCVMSTGSKIYSLTSMPTNPFDLSEIISIVPYDGISPTLIGKVVLEENTWIGINVVVSPGITIKKNSFVRSNSFVLDSFEENSYIAGDPAVYKHKRFKSSG